MKSNQPLNGILFLGLSVLPFIGAYAEEVKLLEYDTRKIITVDSSELEAYRGTHMLSKDADGFTLEWSTNYARITEYDDGTVDIIPLNSEPINFYGLNIGAFGWSSSPLPADFKSVKFEITDSASIEVGPYELAGTYPPKQYSVEGGCTHVGDKTELDVLDFVPLKGYKPKMDLQYSGNSITSVYSSSWAMQYNAETSSVRLYSKLKIRGQYSLDPKPDEFRLSPTVDLIDLKADSERFRVITVKRNELNSYLGKYSIEYDDGGFTIDFNARYVEIVSEANGSYTLRTLNAGLSADETNLFRMPIISKIVDRPTDVKEISFTILESDYHDLKPYKLDGAEWEDYLAEKPAYLPIPFSGFAPNELFTWSKFPNPTLSSRKLAVIGSVMQYNMEESTVRAYTRLKVHCNYIWEENAISSLEADDPSNIEYYDLRGLRIRHPHPGQMIIKRNGSSSKLTIY